MEAAAQKIVGGVENRQRCAVGIDQYLILGWKFRDHSLGCSAGQGTVRWKTTKRERRGVVGTREHAVKQKERK